IGERSGRTYQLAGRVMVKVARVDLERAKIDFTLDESAQIEDVAALARRSFAEPLARGDRARRIGKRASPNRRRGS
ncbi:MAG TPA: ribonuclease R, partial [Casimicrobiaceae bacterium]|nr:ribonuclease R [Casimicrobiaceae bacterium]